MQQPRSTSVQNWSELAALAPQWEALVNLEVGEPSLYPGPWLSQPPRGGVGAVLAQHDGDLLGLLAYSTGSGTQVLLTGGNEAERWGGGLAIVAQQHRVHSKAAITRALCEELAAQLGRTKWGFYLPGLRGSAPLTSLLFAELRPFGCGRPGITGARPYVLLEQLSDHLARAKATPSRPVNLSSIDATTAIKRDVGPGDRRFERALRVPGARCFFVGSEPKRKGSLVVALERPDTRWICAHRGPMVGVIIDEMSRRDLADGRYRHDYVFGVAPPATVPRRLVEYEPERALSVPPLGGIARLRSGARRRW